MLSLFLFQGYSSVFKVPKLISLITNPLCLLIRNIQNNLLFKSYVIASDP